MPNSNHDYDESQLNPFEFRVPASDAKGHSSRQYFRCTPAMSRVVDQMIQSKQFPYRTKGDLFRHALSRHVKWLDGLRPVKSVTAEVDAMMEILRDDEFHNDFINVFEKLGDRISHHMSSGSEGEARRLLLVVGKHVEGMPDGHWKNKYIKELENRYGHVIKNAPKANLRSIDGGKGE